jgi:hypothetical protein
MATSNGDRARTRWRGWPSIRVAAGLDATVRKARAAAAKKVPKQPSGTDLARDN